MEGEDKIQKPKMARKGRKKVKSGVEESPAQQKKQNINEDGQPSGMAESSSSSGWSSEVIEPAIKSMAFRKRRGTRMKELIKGKHRKDHFWDKYEDYFGGNLDKPQDEDDQEDYEASSSGRDQFDSDFDLTDSYVGKRGRKKGTKVKRRKRPISKPAEKKEELEPKPKGKRGRKKKVPVELPPQQKQELLLKEEKLHNQDNPASVNAPHQLQAELTFEPTQEKPKGSVFVGEHLISANGEGIKVLNMPEEINGFGRINEVVRVETDHLQWVAEDKNQMEVEVKEAL